jgi:transcriptional regulator with XRE-family HTH domain
VLSLQAGIMVKNHRALKGWTQEELARTARVSRTILSNLESGKAKPVQTDVLERLLGALGIEPRLVGDSLALELKRQARAEHQCKLEQQRNRHLRIALTLAGDEKRARSMVAKARERVELWRDKRSCSPYYIKRWSTLLSLPPRKLAAAMSGLGEWEDAMFQNSPWSWSWS